MKRSLLLMLAVAFGTFSFAQSIERQVIATAGDYFENEFGSISWTLGEPVVETFYSPDFSMILTQGFQQPDIFLKEETSAPVSLDIVNGTSVLLFPNPATHQLNINLKTDMSGRVVIEMIDVLGRILQKDFVDLGAGVNHLTHKMNVNTYAAGMYFVRLTNESEKYISTHKFNKAE